jgi:hypothetical protein
MLEVDFILNDGKDFHWSTNVRSGDEKGNKTTWTVKETHSEFTKKKYGVGNEVPLPGVADMQLFLKAVGVNPEIKDGQIKHKDKVINAGVMPDLQGTKLKLGITQYEDTYNGDITVRNEIKYFMDMAGNNNKGNNIEEKALKYITKNPIKKLKGAPAQATATSGSETSIPSGWS